MAYKNKKKFPSELRYDLVSQDWVVIAMGRARRPETFKQERKSKIYALGDGCPFDRLSRNERPTAAFLGGKKVPLRQGTFLPLRWSAVSIQNKYPAFSPGGSLRVRAVGPYKAMDGVGFHEVVVTKDHAKDIPEFSLEQVRELIELYQERYLDLMNEQFVNYVAIFKNKGPGAGATIAHPHSQIIATPVTDPDIERSLEGSLHYWKAHRRCVHCAMVALDRKEKQRIVYENDCFVALCPFASRVAFELRLYPKAHTAYFERSDESQKYCFAQVLQVALQKLKKALNNPDYNYFLHTAPADGKNYDHYHWHLEILPKTSTWAGFELGTGIEISTIEPEKAAAFLRKQ